MKIYQIADVAEKLRISKQTILRYEKKGIFPCPKRNKINHWREYSEEDINKMVQLLGRGMTVIELTMVMVIIGILAALVVPRFEGFYFIKFNGAMKRVLQDIRYVQQLAISRHEDYKIYFDASANKYEVRKVSDNSLAVNPFGRNNFVVNFNTDPQYSGIDITSANFGSGDPSLRFNWQGAPLNGSGVSLTTEGTVGFSYKNNSFSIYIKPNTGWARVE